MPPFIGFMIELGRSIPGLKGEGQSRGGVIVSVSD